MDVDVAVALVNMPMDRPDNPALGLSLLKSGLARRQISARVHYLNLWFREAVGSSDHDDVLEFSQGTLAGEWVFTEALWGPDPERDDGYMRFVKRSYKCGSDKQVSETIDRLRRVRQEVEPFLQRCLSEIPWHRYKVVGFTSIFHQHLASLALARRLKEAYPHLLIAFGGSNCHGDMGRVLLENFPFVDLVCTGEGDRVFPLFLEKYLNGVSPGYIPGLIYRPTLGIHNDQAESADAMVHQMDELPYPDFDDYFTEFDRLSPVARPKVVGLPFETSRGCWWGQKSHCLFCGVNGSDLVFREKSPDRAITEVNWLLERHGHRTRNLFAVDNILPMSYFRTFLPALKESGTQVDLFYETKANLRKDQIELLAAVGVRQIQPGIESLSAPVLRYIGKGVTPLQNIQLLKFCLQFGIRVSWNYLIGFPGEKPEYYAGQSELVRAISHLEPPRAAPWTLVHLVPFSPFVTRPEVYGIRNLRPHPAYAYLLSGLSEEARHRLAWAFVGDFDGKAHILDYTAELRGAMDDWYRKGNRYHLFSFQMGGTLVVCDLRPGASEPVFTLRGLQRVLLEGCDQITSQKQMLELLSSAKGQPATPEELQTALQPLIDRRLILQEGNFFLSLPITMGSWQSVAGKAVKRLPSQIWSWSSDRLRGLLSRLKAPAVTQG